VITDDGLPEEVRTALTEQGVTLIIAKG